MKLYLEDDNGNRTEFKELHESFNDSNVLIFTTNKQISMENAAGIINKLEKLTNKRCVVLDSAFDKVYGIK
jgi:hypothetical protein